MKNYLLFSLMLLSIACISQDFSFIDTAICPPYEAKSINCSNTSPAFVNRYNDETMNQNLVIKPGKTLIIKSTVKFQKDCKIVVEPGAKLILDGCRLTNSDCGNNMWKGIEVQGNKNLRQYPETNQGVVEIINGGTIENAVAAIRTLNSGDAHPLDFTGGIIKANRAIFKNNYSGIYFATYHNHLSNGSLTGNISYIQNCTFEINLY
ncbi:MAG: hypothetical protein A2X08_02675 [Bacteroidetes bacterium GWA2_32_17]|nr:MAG: hypothetical protein A2X08_02675 [Bacteroidetes bacterium GWA2_32_17]